MRGLTIDDPTGTEQHGPLLREAVSQRLLAAASPREGLLGGHHARLAVYCVKVVKNHREDPRQPREHDERCDGLRQAVIGRWPYREVIDGEGRNTELPVVDVAWPPEPVC